MAKKFVAITGGIGSGKSLALQFLRELNYPVFSCDVIYKKLILSKEYIKKVGELFPNAVKNGEIDRAALSEIVFINEEKRLQLNNLAHPLIMDLLFQNMRAAEGEVAFAEVPLLFEGNFEKMFDQVIYIARDKQERIMSVVARDGLSNDDVEKRIVSQFDGLSPIGQKRLKECNATVIYNNSTKEKFKEDVLTFTSSL